METKNKNGSNTIIVIAILIFVVGIILTITNDNKEKEAKPQEAIVLHPEDHRVLQINDKEWSCWIDASKVYSYAHTNGYGIKQLFANGDSITVRPGEGKKLIPDEKGYSVYKLKTPPGTGTKKVFIEASDRPINKDLYD